MLKTECLYLILKNEYLQKANKARYFNDEDSAELSCAVLTQVF